MEDLKEQYIKNYNKTETKRKNQKKYLQHALLSILSLIISPASILIIKPFFNPYHSIVIWFMLLLILFSFFLWKLYKYNRAIPTLKENLFYHTFDIIVNLKKLKKEMTNTEYVKNISRSLDRIGDSIERDGIIDDTGFNREKLKLIDSSLKMFYENIPQYKKSLQEHRKKKIEGRISLFGNVLTYLDEEKFGELNELMKKDYKKPKKKELINAIQGYYPFLSYSIALIITLSSCFVSIFIFNFSISRNLSSILAIVVSVIVIIQSIKNVMAWDLIKKRVISIYIQINRLFHTTNNSK